MDQYVSWCLPAEELTLDTAGKYKKKKSSVKPRQSCYMQHVSESSQVQSQHRKWCDVKSAQRGKTDAQNVVIQLM